jgi:hypothetical protein
MKGTLASAVIAMYGQSNKPRDQEFAPASQRRVGFLCRSTDGWSTTRIRRFLNRRSPLRSRWRVPRKELELRHRAQVSNSN